MTAFDTLTYETLLFLEENTKDKEPWAGFGFATEVHKQIKEALERKGKENKVPVFKKTTLRELVNLIITTPNVSCNLDREVVLQIQSPLERGMYQPQYTQYLNHIFTGSGQVLLVGRTNDPAVVLK